MRIRGLVGALVVSAVVGVSLPSEAEAARRHRSSGDHRGYSSRSYRAPRHSSAYRSRGYTYRSYDRHRSYDRYRSYNRYRYRPRLSFGYRSYVPYAYDPYYTYGYDPYLYEPYDYGYDPYGYNGPYPRYRRAHYHGRLFCVRPHLSVHVGF